MGSFTGKLSGRKGSLMICSRRNIHRRRRSWVGWFAACGLLAGLGCEGRSPAQPVDHIDRKGSAQLDESELPTAPGGHGDAEALSATTHETQGAVLNESASLTQAIEHFCGNCHATPRPDSFPKRMWYEEVKRGYDFYYQSRRTDLRVPVQSQVVAYFRDQAPEDLPFGPIPAATVASPIRWSRESWRYRPHRSGTVGERQPQGQQLQNAPLNSENASSLPQNRGESPAISFVGFSSGWPIAGGLSAAEVDSGARLGESVRFGQDWCWISDMRSGQIMAYHVADATWWRLDHPAQNPASVRLGDLDSNGVADVLVTDLGSFLPADHQDGRVIWIPDVATALRPVNDSAQPFTQASSGSTEQQGLPSPDESLAEPSKIALSEPAILLDQVGRVADIEVADLDLDGDMDLVVAEFGWHETGGVHVLWNEHTSPAGNEGAAVSPPGEPISDDQASSKMSVGPLSFRRQRLDRRPGSIHVRCRDFDGDGRPDISSLISQEHETIVVWLNRPASTTSEEGDLATPKGTHWPVQLVPHVIYTADDPSAGSSGMEVVDLDQDGDQDVVYTSGDTFDSYINKPTHGVYWLENTGTFPFSVRTLTTLPGAHRALPADFDGDGDLDLAVSAFVPDKLHSMAGADHLRALLWLEQQPGGLFVRHDVSTTEPVHAAMAVVDIDRDGDPDLVAGAFLEDTLATRNPLDIYRNQGVSTKAAGGVPSE
jgi:hypothetical protein